MDIPRNNTPELAQWYLERGKDQKRSALAWLICSPFMLPVFFLIPFVWVYCYMEWKEGSRHYKLGLAMNEAAGRESKLRPLGVPTNGFQRGYGDRNARHYPVPDTPPVKPLF